MNRLDATSPIPAALLLRRSTGMQDKSIPDQRSFVLDWARRHNYLPGVEFVDDAISGDDGRHRRGYQELLQELDNPARRWNVLLVYDRSRFTRADLYEAASDAQRFLQAGVDVIYCAEGKSLSTDHEIVWAVETYQKHEVLKQTSRDTLRGMMKLAELGFWCGGPIPYGLDGEIVDKLTLKPVRRLRLIRRKATGADGRHEPAIHHVYDLEGNLIREIESSTEDTLPLKSEAELTRLILSEPQRVEAVKLIFAWMADEKAGLKGIANELNRRQIPPPGGRGLWKTSAVRAILNNKIYMGWREWNRRTEAKYHSIRNGTTVPRPRHEKGKIVEHEERDRIRVHIPHIAIVSEEIWHRAQKVRAQRATVNYRERAHLHTHSLLGGKIYCGDCGAKMYGHYSKKAKRVSGVLKTFVQHLYVCSTYLNSGRDHCGYNKVPRKALERFVLEKMRETLHPLLSSTGVRQRVKAQLQKLYGGPRQTAVTIQKRLKELEERIRILERLDEKERATLGMDISYHQAKEELSKLAKVADAGPVPHVDIEATTNEIMDCLSNLENFENLPARTQKTFFEKFVERIDLEFEKVKKDKKVMTALKRGVLQLASPLPTSPSLGLDGSGGGI